MTKKYAVFVAVLAVIIFGYYTLSPLFKEERLVEEIPVTAENISDPFPITSTAGHPASGYVKVIDTEDKTIVRYEGFYTINGPDLFVYLANDLEAEDYVSLGRLRATNGNINYEVPSDVNVEDYKYAMVWCKAFGVLFNYSQIN